MAPPPPEGAPPRLQRAQLFQLLAQFERAGRQAHETVQRRAAVRIDTDMVPARPIPPGDRQAREIQRRRDARIALEGAGGLHEGWRIRLLLIRDRADQRADVHRRVGERFQHGAQRLGRDGREIPLQVHHDVVAALGVQHRHRPLHAVGARGHVVRHQHRPCPRRLGRRHDLGFPRGDGEGADSRLPRAVQHMGDHRPAGDLGQRLARQPGGRHAGRDNDDGAQAGGSGNDDAGRLSGGRPGTMVRRVLGKAVPRRKRSAGKGCDGLRSAWRTSRATRSSRRS